MPVHCVLPGVRGVVAAATMSAMVKLAPRNAVDGVSQEKAGHLARSMRLFTTLESSSVRSVVAKSGEARAGFCSCAHMSLVAAWCPSLRDVSSADRRCHGHDVSYGEAHASMSWLRQGAPPLRCKLSSPSKTGGRAWRSRLRQQAQHVVRSAPAHTSDFRVFNEQ